MSLNNKRNLTVNKFSKIEVQPKDRETDKISYKKIPYVSNTENETSSLNNVPNFSNFKGFFNKKFNLTAFKEEKEKSRSRSNSPKKTITPNTIKGNGIPKDAVSRIKYLYKICNSEKFQNYYNINFNNKNKKVSFRELCDLIIKYSKKTSELEGIIFAYYYICQKIQYDYSFNDRNEKYKESQQPEHVFRYKRALSLGFTNLFEYLLKKLGVKVKHIDGYCKLIPSRDKEKEINNSNNSKINDLENLNNTSSHIDSNFNNTNNNSKTLFTKNISHVFKNNNSSIFNSSIVNGFSSTLNKFDSEREYDNNIENHANHCWNAFFYRGEWYLVDTVIGSVSYDKNKLNLENKTFKDGKLITVSKKNFNEQKENNVNYQENEFSPFYFMTLPDLLIDTHIPVNSSWQMTAKIFSFKQFLNKKNIDKNIFYKNVSEYNVELLSHDDPIIQISNKEILKIKIRVLNYTLDCFLYDAVGFKKINEVKTFIDHKNKIYTLEPIFPKTGEYIIRINMRSSKSTDLIYKHLIDYQIKVLSNFCFSPFEKYSKDGKNNDKNEMNFILPKIHGYQTPNQMSQPRIITDYNKIFPSRTNKIICYDNEGFTLIEPKTIYIKKDYKVKFKIAIQNASMVFLLDGNKWMQLKRVEKGVYGGQKVIKTENVSICCMRNKNVFTEVFRFKVKKQLYFSKSTGMKIRSVSKIDNDNSHIKIDINDNNKNKFP